MPEPLHRQATVIDGLIVSNWSRSLFEAMHAGGLTAANCTCAVWDGFDSAFRRLATWKRWLADNADILLQVYGVDDIARAKREGRVGVILGWQNSAGFDEEPSFVPVFHELGLRVVQLTYHTANAAGSGCLEANDAGLSSWGHELVAELNRTGILIDLSHVGSRTARDAIRVSKQPVAYTHCAPKALRDHPRNKTDDDLRAIAERGGVIGVTMFPPFMPRGNDSTLDDYLDAIEHVIAIAGEEQVAIGTDFTQDIDEEGLRYFTRYKGTGHALLEIGNVVNPKEFGRIEQYPNLTAAMERRGWTETRIRRVLGENWLRLFGEVWR